MVVAVEAASDAGVAQEFRVADRGGEGGAAVVEFVPGVGVGAPSEVEAVFAVFGEVGEEVSGGGVGGAEGGGERR